jgi:hypothetical protein
VRALVLATTVRRTGSPRRTCLIYGTSGNEYVVVASKGGAEQDPGIVHETRGGPQHRGAGRQSPVHRTRPRRVRGRARPSGPDGDISPLDHDYAQKTDREIPIVPLTPPRMSEAPGRRAAD